jgi:biopolymer transport protein ExbD
MAQSKFVKELTKQGAQMDMTPVIDMSFLLIIFFICLPFKTLEGKLQAFLPTNKGINPTPQDPIQEVKIQVHIRGRKTMTVRWGPENQQREVTRPTDVVYTIGDKETKDLDELGRWIAATIDQARAAGDPSLKIVGEIKAGHKVAHKYVVAVLNKFAELRMEKIDFYGTALPPPEIRKSTWLPFPTTNYVGESPN